MPTSGVQHVIDGHGLVVLQVQAGEGNEIFFTINLRLRLCRPPDLRPTEGQSAHACQDALGISNGGDSGSGALGYVIAHEAVEVVEIVVHVELEELARRGGKVVALRL